MAAVGSCLNAWAWVENGMGLLFYNVSGIDHMARAGAIFDSVVAFEGRIAMLDAAIDHEPLLSDEEKLIWACLSRRLRKLYKRRHAVAHFSIVDESYQAISPFFTWNKQAKKTAKTLTIGQISERSRQFSEASAAVSWFGGHMQSRKLQIPVHPQLIEAPPLILRILELLSRSQRGDEPPDQSSGE
jgi:hypothetical protein